MNLFNKARGKFVADVDEIRPQYQDSNLSDGAAVFNSSLVRSVGPSIGATIDQLDALTLTEVGSLNELATPWYADQVLPFADRPGLFILWHHRSSRARQGTVCPDPYCSGRYLRETKKRKYGVSDPDVGSIWIPTSTHRRRVQPRFRGSMGTYGTRLGSRGDKASQRAYYGDRAKERD
jgi:hypothetical protein